MSKDFQAQAITIALIVAILVFIAWNQGGFEFLKRGQETASFSGGNQTVGKEPRDVIYAMLDAAREGLVEEYLTCYTDQIEQTLRQSHDEMGREKFAEFLKARNRDIKGIAMNAPQGTDEEPQVRVEYVYADRNEVQQFFLRDENDQWKISRVSEIQRIETPVPYGTPVN